MGDRSIREFFSSPTRYLAQAISKESEFEKPYLDDDRGRMHSDPSWPDWPPFPDIPPWPPLPDIPGPGPLPGCAILCYPPGGSDCNDSIWCHPGIWCGQDIGCTLCTWVVEGATSGYTPHASGVGSWGIDVWIDTDLVEEGGEALVKICMTDPCGNICCDDVEVRCSACPPETVMTWDSVNSAETVVRSGTAGVYVKDGLGPYTWSVTGTGFSMLHNETTVLYNTLQADATACGTATVTVTDFCGDSTEGIVRCTTGTWDLAILQCRACKADSEDICPAIGCATCTSPAWYTEGKYRWRYGTAFEYYEGYDGCPPPWKAYTLPCPTTLCSEEPPCGDPVTCAGGTPCVAGRVCYVGTFNKDEWIC